MQFHTAVAAIGRKENIKGLKSDFCLLNCSHHTSEEASSLTEALEPEIDLSEVLLALDLMEALLELFGVPANST